MMQLFEHQDLLITLLSVIVALWLLLSVIMKVWPFVSKLVTMVNGFVGYGDEPGVLERIKTLEENSATDQDIHQKMSEQFDRVEAKLTILSNRMDESVADRQQLWEIARQHHQGEIQE